MENLKQMAEHAIAFWYLSNTTKNGTFWDSPAGMFVLAIMPGIITAVLTAFVTVGGIYLSMRDDMKTLQQNMVQMQEQHKQFYAQQEIQDRRLMESERDIARMRGMLEANHNGDINELRRSLRSPNQ